MNDRIDKLLEWAMVRLFMDCPLYAAMATSFPTVARDLPEDHRFGATNGAIMAITKTKPMADSITKENILGLLGNLTNHIILHHTRPAVTVEHPDLYRAAQELEAEMWVPESFGPFDKSLRDTAMDYKYKGLDTVEKIYLHWVDKKKETPKIPLLSALLGAGGDVENAGVLGAPEPIDMVISKVMQATALAKSMGSVPAELLQKIEELRKPRVNWRSFLRQFWGTKVGIWDLDVTKFSPFYYAAYNLPLPPLADTHGSPDVVLALDTSGSMSGKPLEMVIAEIRGLAGLTSEVDVYISDAAVHGIVTLKEVTDEEILALRDQLRGNGGTSFVPVFEEVKKRKSQPQLLVYLTDTWGEYPKDHPPYPVIWLTPVPNPETPPFGQLIKIPPEEYM